MKKTEESEEVTGRREKSQEIISAAERWRRWSSRSLPSARQGGASADRPARPEGGEIQAAVGGVGDLLVHVVHGRVGILRKSWDLIGS